MNIYDLYGILARENFTISHIEFDNFCCTEELYTKIDSFFDKENDIILFLSKTIEDAKDKYYSFDKLLTDKYNLDCSLISDTKFHSLANRFFRIGAVKIPNGQISKALELLCNYSFSSFCISAKKDISFELTKKVVDILAKNMFSWKSILYCCKLSFEYDASFVHINTAENGFSINQLKKRSTIRQGNNNQGRQL